MIEKIGLQTFTIRNDIQTPQEIENSLRFYSSKGIKKFELARINFFKEDLNVLLKLKHELGLEYTASQITLKKIIKKFDFLIEFSNALDIKYLEVSVIPFIYFLQKQNGIIELSQKLNELGRKTKERGINLLFHHHNYELIKYNDKLSLDILMNNTDSNLVNFVCDTYWLARSGYNPSSFIQSRIDRVKGLHLRDNKFYYSFGKFNYTDTTIGDGTIDFESILNLDKLGNIDFYSIEQDTQNPREDILRSYSYLNELCEN